jgi:hypothetical protein
MTRRLEFGGAVYWRVRRDSEHRHLVREIRVISGCFQKNWLLKSYK